MKQRNYVHSQNEMNVVTRLVSKMILFSSIMYMYIIHLNVFSSNYMLHYYYDYLLLF